MQPSILFHMGPQDTEKQLSFLKPILSGKARVSISNIVPIAATQIVMKAKEKECTQIATTSPKLLQLLLGQIGEKLPSLDDYAGSIITKFGCEFLILNPLEHLFTVNYGKFLYERYLAKFLQPDRWLQLPTFKWELYNPSITDEILSCFEKADFISADIETGSESERVITCIGFTAVWINSEGAGSFSCRTVVVPFTDMFNVIFTRRLLGLSPPKLFQNGKYDNAYLLRYGIHTRNWCFDTVNLFHAWFAELPKRLDFITSFNLRNWQYWKDQAKTSDKMQYYEYNARDAFATAMSWLAMLREVPPYAWQNYNMEFPVVLASISSEMTGVKVRESERKRLEDAVVPAMVEELASIQKMVGCKFYNPSSPPQTLSVFKMLGSGDVKNTTPPSMDKVSNRHPINARIIKKIIKYRKDRKLFSSYLQKEVFWTGRWFFALNPHGTETGRNASKKSHFWCGNNFQNVPARRRDLQIKDMVVADDGFFLAEADGEQAEARDTAYLSGDTNLIAALEDKSKDFHPSNASSFFGIPYEQLCDSKCEDGVWYHKRLDEDIIDLAKRTNHGANYNMKALKMLDTMGEKNVLRAKNLLNLPSRYRLRDVTQHLLDAYEKKYPIVKNQWYDKVKQDVEGSRFLVGPTGWTRYCFGHPSKNGNDLNEYVAHPPQSLNAMVLNKAFIRVFLEVYLPNIGNFKLIAQIHDSIFFQYRIGYEHLAWQVKKIMEIPVPVTDVFGITRILIVPVALKGRGTVWSKLKKMKSPDERDE